MLRASILIFVISLCGTSLIAQDDLAQYQSQMKAANAATMGLRKAVTEKDNAAIKTNVDNGTKAFDWIATFFQQKGKEDGVKFAKASAAALKAVGDATTPEDQTAAVRKVGPTCAACHMVYREGQTSAFKGM